MARDGRGAPRIQGELLMLGFEISEVTVSRYMPRRPVEPDKVKRWMAFLRNHKDAIAARDFFTVPTASFRVLYVLFVIEHGRRRVRHFNVTSNPTSERPIAAPGKMQSPSAGSEVVGESSLSKL
jgi:putative transposase